MVRKPHFSPEVHDDGKRGAEVRGPRWGGREQENGVYLEAKEGEATTRARGRCEATPVPWGCPGLLRASAGWVLASADTGSSSQTSCPEGRISGLSPAFAREGMATRGLAGRAGRVFALAFGARNAWV